MYRFLLTTVFALVTVCSQAMAHPCDEFNANESLIYENLLGESAWQAGEIKFYSLSDRTPYSQLSNTERYMVAGGVDPETGLNYAPWYDQVMDVVKMYFARNEAVPAELSHELVDALDDDRELEEDSLAFRILHNPVQDRPVRLDAVDFSPGDMYVQTVSQEEQILLSYYSPAFKRILHLDFDTNPDAGFVNTPMPPIDGPVYYFRLYGETGVLMAGLMYKREQ